MGARLLAAVLVTTVFRFATGQFCVSNKTCNGHGYCPESCTSKCVCTNDYTGTFCTIPPVCTENGGQCGVNGDCVNNYCDCKNNYKGQVCENPPICSATGNECGAYGECYTCIAGYSICRCNSGYGGDTCNIAPVCTEGGNECKNGGMCNFGVTPFNCTCPIGFSGDTCGANQVTGFRACLVLFLFQSLMATRN